MATTKQKEAVVVKPYDKNAKKHPDTQLKQIALSLKEYGWRQPIVTDKNDEIIVGHGRWMAYQKYPEGIKEPWVVKAEDLTPEQVKGYRLMDNKSNESDWDMDLAIEELKELDSLGFDIELTGFDRDLLIEPDDKDDLIPTDPPTRAKMGDVWLLGEHKVMCGDSTDKDAVEALMEGKKADMVFTDPPYGVSMSRSLVSGKENSIKNDDLDEDALYELLDKSIAHAVDNSKNNVPLYVWIGFRAYSLAESVIKQYFKINNCIVWKKPSIGLGGNGYRLQHELCIFSGQVDDKSQSDVWEFDRDSSGIHPTIKPVALITKALLNSLNENDLVLDLFLGSGSTLIAAEKTGRICYGMEMDPKYVDVILKRWEDYTGKTAIKQV